MGLGDIFGSTNYGFNTGDIEAQAARRSQEISDFGSKLSAMRSAYMAQIPALQTAAFNQFGNNAAASFGARGMTADSGAFQAELARAAIPMQAQMANTAYQTGVQNENAVNAARAQASQATMGAMSAGMSRPTPNPFGAALGNLIGQGAMMYMGSKLLAPAAPAAGGFGNYGPAVNPAMLPGGAMAPSRAMPAVTWADTPRMDRFGNP
jgi:hypothetical protein